MKEALAESIGLVCVIDVETAPDPIAASYAAVRGRSTDDKTALHRLTDASMLFAREDADGGWSGFDLRSFTIEDDDEERLLRNIDGQLQRVGDGVGRLASFNGISHDLPVLRRRAARHLAFDLPGIFPVRDQAHLDLMRIVPSPRPWRPGSLRDQAAGLGMPVAYQFGRDGIGARSKGIRKSQVDVSATFILMLYEIAARRGRADPVIRGWRAFGDYIRRMGPHGEHLAQFRRCALGGDPDLA